MAKRFRILVQGSNEDVMGGAIGERNAYINAYPRPQDGQKHPLSLEVGEKSVCVYSLSGTSGTYDVVRLEDGESPEPV